MATKPSWQDKVKALWYTECQFCRRARLLLLWLVLMFIVDGLYFHLVFSF